MDRVTVYPGQIPFETDVLRTNKFGMMALAKLAAAVLGTSTIVNGLACVPTSPASLQVNVNPGEMYSLVIVDATAYSSLAADTTHSILKQGISLDAVTLNCPAPATGGQSVNYLIQATYQDSDTDNVALPYYNASNPSQAWSGPNNSGTPQSTTRKGVIVISAKTGTAATTGTQTTPAPDAGYTGLWVVTVANGQSTITAGNISQYAGAPILPSSLLSSIQSGNLSFAVAMGTANAHTVALTPALTARVDGMMIRYKAPAANTGAVTLNDGVGTASVVGANHAALQGNEYSANGDAIVMWNSSIGGGSYILVECTGGAVQVAPATQTQHAPQFSQIASALGAVNTRVYTAAASSFTLSADRVVAVTALAGGIAYTTSAFSKTINLTTTGAGGMDTGSAPTSGYVAIYAIYNPTTNTWALLATNATSAAAPEVYGGANMPSGYTASCLVSVWGTTSTANQFRAGLQRGRNITFVAVVCLNTSTTQASYTSLSLSSTVPPNATTVYGSANPQSSAASTLQVHIAGDGAGVGDNYIVATSSSTGSVGTSGIFRAAMSAAQTIYYQWSNTGGTPQLGINVSGYDF